MILSRSDHGFYFHNFIKFSSWTECCGNWIGGTLRIKLLCCKVCRIIPMELKTSWGAQVVPRSRHDGSEVGLGADCHEVASRAHGQDSWGLCPRGKHAGKWGEVWVPQVLWQDLRSLINLCRLCSLNCKIRSNDRSEHLTRWSWGQMETGCHRDVKLGRALLLLCVCSLPGGEDTEVRTIFLCVLLHVC